MDPKYNVTKTVEGSKEHQIFEYIKRVCNSSTVRITNLENSMTSLLEIYKINFVNCNNVNLFAEAIKSEAKIVVALFTKLAEEEFENATRVASRLVKSGERYIYPSEQEHQDEERQKELADHAATQKSIFDAAQDGDLERLSQILETNPELVNSTDQSEWTAAEIAAHNGKLEALKLLVETYKADTSKLPHPALLRAFPEIIEYMITQRIISAEELVIKAVEDPQYIEATGPVIATIDGVNYRLSFKGTALHHALGVGNTAAATKLLDEHKADPEVPNDDGDRAIHYAVRTDQKVSFDLLKDRCKLDSGNTQTGDTILHIADSREMLEHIIEVVPQKEILELAQTVNDAGSNPAHAYASRTDNGELLGVFLEKIPAEPSFKEGLCNLRGSDGKTVCDIARENETIQAVLASNHIEIPEIVQEPEVVEDVRSNTPEPVAQTESSSLDKSPTKSLKASSESATPVNSPRKTEPNTPKTPKTPIVPKKSHQDLLQEIFRAIRDDNGEIITNILSKHSELDFTNVQLDSGSPGQQSVNLLEVAHNHNKFKALNALVTHWMPQNLKALVDAIMSNNEESIRFIIGSDVDIQNIKIAKESSTVKNYPGVKLCEFTPKGFEDSFSFYFPYNSNVNKFSLLQLATFMDKAHAVDALLDCKVDPDYQCEKGYTALHYAVECESDKSLSILLHWDNSKACTVRTYGTAGNQTPVEMAAYLNKQDIFPHFFAKAESDQEKYLCLLSAIKGGSIKIVSDILAQDIKFLSYCSSSTKVNTIMEMVKAKNDVFVKVILDKKFTTQVQKMVSHKDALGQNILHYIAAFGNKEMLASFLGQYVNEFNSLVQGQDDKGNFPLYVAACRDDDTYNVFKGYLSKYKVVKQTKGSFFTKSKTTEVCEPLPFEVADNIHKTYLKSMTYEPSIQGSVSNLAAAQDSQHKHEDETVKLLADQVCEDA